MTSTRQPTDTRAGARTSAVVGSWPDVEVGAHRFGGVEFRLGRRELGHLHGDSHADIAFRARFGMSLSRPGVRYLTARSPTRDGNWGPPGCWALGAT